MEDNGDDQFTKATNRLKDSARDLGRKGAEKVGKSAAESVANIVKWVIQQIIKFIAWIVAMIGPLIIIVIILSVGVFAIIASFFKKDTDNVDPTIDLSYDTTVEEMDPIITLSKDQKRYKINKEYARKILKKLEEIGKVDTTVFGFKDEDYDYNAEPEEGTEGTEGTEGAGSELTEKELKNMLDKYIRAELQTMYPDIGNWIFGEKGGVKVHRISNEYGEIEMKYMPYNDFIKLESMVYDNAEKAREEVLQYFALDPDTLQLCIYVSTTTNIYNYPNTLASTQVTFEMQTLNYQTLLQKYATPTIFLIAMHLISQDVDFMDDLVELVNSSETTMSFIEDSTANYTQVDYSGTVTELKVSADVVATPIPAPPFVSISVQNPQVTPNVTQVTTANINEPQYSKYITDGVKPYITEVITNAGRLMVTKAETWLVSSELMVYSLDSVTTQTGEGTKNYSGTDGDLGSSDKFDLGLASSGLGLKVSYSTFTYNIDEITKYYNTTYPIDAIETKQGYRLDYINALLDLYPKVKRNLTTAPNDLFYMLEQYESTQELERVMKYIIAQLTGRSYGVDSLDILDTTDFVTMGDTDGAASAGESGGTGMDMSSLVGTDEWESANEIQKKIVTVATHTADYGIAAKYGYCLLWNQQVYQAAGATATGGQGIARMAGHNFGVSTDFSFVPLGACIYGLGSAKSTAGHCAIYIGNGQVAHNIGYVKIEPLSDWISKYRGKVWGWCSSTPVNSNYPVTPGLMTGQGGIIN